MTKQPPKHPLGFTCDTCACWLTEHKQEVYLQPNGQAIPVAAARQMGMQTLGAPKVEAAPCTWGPNWIITPGKQFCWQWKNRLPEMTEEQISSNQRRNMFG